MITLFDYTFEFIGKRPRINGEVVTKKNVIVSCINYLILKSGYHFNYVSRPCPSWLINWRDMEFNFLASALQNMVIQMEYLLPLNRINDYSLESDGFHYIYVYNLQTKDYGRVCKIELKSDQRHESSLTTLDSCAALIQRWFDTPNLTSRSVVIT